MASKDELLNLNVGGCIYTTSRSTLTRYPDSMLGSMFSDRLPSNVDDRNRYFIDGDGKTFRHILNFLRRSKLILPDDFQEWDILSAEADYYQIQELIRTIDEKRKHIRQKSYEFLEVEFDRFYNACTIYCKPCVLAQLLEISMMWFVGGLTASAYIDLKLQFNTSMETEAGFIIPTMLYTGASYDWEQKINRLRLLEEISKLGFTLVVKSSRCGVYDQSIRPFGRVYDTNTMNVCEHKWTFSREVTEN